MVKKRKAESGSIVLYVAVPAVFLFVVFGILMSLYFGFGNNTLPLGRDNKMTACAVNRVLFGPLGEGKSFPVLNVLKGLVVGTESLQNDILKETKEKYTYSYPAWYGGEGALLCVGKEKGRRRSSLILTGQKSGADRVFLTLTDKALFHPRLSPDGAKIAFFSAESKGYAASPGQTALLLYDLAGDFFEELAPLDLPAERLVPCAWSPDGKRLVFNRREGEIVLLTLKGRKEEKLAEGRSPAWNHKKNLIAYVSAKRDNLVKIVTPDGRKVGSFEVRGSVLSLCWSPRGDFLSFFEYHWPYNITFSILDSSFKKVYQLTHVGRPFYSGHSWRMSACSSRD